MPICQAFDHYDYNGVSNIDSDLSNRNFYGHKNGNSSTTINNLSTNLKSTDSTSNNNFSYLNKNFKKSKLNTTENQESSKQKEYSINAYTDYSENRLINQNEYSNTYTMTKTQEKQSLLRLKNLESMANGNKIVLKKIQPLKNMNFLSDMSPNCSPINYKMDTQSKDRQLFGNDSTINRIKHVKNSKSVNKKINILDSGSSKNDDKYLEGKYTKPNYRNSSTKQAYPKNNRQSDTFDIKLFSQEIDGYKINESRLYNDKKERITEKLGSKHIYKHSLGSMSTKNMRPKAIRDDIDSSSKYTPGLNNSKDTFSYVTKSYTNDKSVSKPS